MNRLHQLATASNTLRAAGGDDMYDLADAIDETVRIEARLLEAAQVVAGHLWDAEDWDAEGKVCGDLRAAIARALDTHAKIR